MRFCDAHWGKLRAAIAERGLAHLVAVDGCRAVANAAAEMTAGRTVTNFDPLMGAHWAIVNRVMDVTGLAVMLPNDDGSERCPLCYAKEWHGATCTNPECAVDADTIEAWIPSVAEHMRAEWERLLAEEAGQ